MPVQGWRIDEIATGRLESCAGNVSVIDVDESNNGVAEGTPLNSRSVSVFVS